QSGAGRGAADRAVLFEQLCRDVPDVRQDRRQRFWRPSALPISEERKIRAAGFVDQMEFHQIPDRSFRQGGGAACADHDAPGADQRNRGTALSEKNEAISERLPDRPSVDPKSPYYNEQVLSRDVGIRFKGVQKTNVEEYCVS